MYTPYINQRLSGLCSHSARARSCRSSPHQTLTTHAQRTSELCSRSTFSILRKPLGLCAAGCTWLIQRTLMVVVHACGVQEGRTPIHFAAKYGYHEIAKVLKAANADVKVKEHVCARRCAGMLHRCNTKLPKSNDVLCSERHSY